LNNMNAKELRQITNTVLNDLSAFEKEWQKVESYIVAQATARAYQGHSDWSFWLNSEPLKNLNGYATEVSDKVFEMGFRYEITNMDDNQQITISW
jgi:hypothetical protein